MALATLIQPQADASPPAFPAIPEPEWRSIPGWPEYQVSENGNVRRIGAATGAVVGRILRPLQNRTTGYLSVCLSRPGTSLRIDIHRLVALAFLGAPPSPDHLVAHNDGNRLNNHRSNLRWATQKENLADCRKHGTALLGSANPMTYLDEVDVRAIRAMKARGIPRKIIADGYGIGVRTVYRILAGEGWRHVQ